MQPWQRRRVIVMTQVGKHTNDPHPAMQPEQTVGFVTAEFDMDAIAEFRHRCAQWPPPNVTL